MSTAMSIQWRSIVPTAAAREPLVILQAARRWISHWSLDERTRILSEAEDHVDLERRMRDWDERERHSFLFLLP